MSRLIKGARFNPEKVRRHLREQDVDSSRGLDLLFDNAGACFRSADSAGTMSYILSCRMAGYRPQYYR
jgi:hypothetical protein